MATVSVVVMTAGCSSDEELPTSLPEPVQITMTGAESRVVEASTDFGIELFKAVCAQHQGENVIISPLSASMALSMAANGASNDALAEILTALGVDGGDLPALNNVNARILETLPKTDPTTVVTLGNSIWLNKGYAINSGYASDMKRIYGATVENTDFSTMSGIDRINAWVKSQGNGMLDRIYSEPQPQLTGAILNALYFNGRWSSIFNAANTREAQFYGTHHTGTVQMMHEVGYYRMYGTDGYTLLKKAFGNGAFIMDFILPDESVDEVLAMMSPTELRAALSTAEPYDVDLYVPRLTENISINLIDAIKCMGAEKLFNAGSLSGIAPGFYSAGMEQKVILGLDEEGGKVFALNTTGMCGSYLPQEPVEFRLDRPFLFMIHEESTGAILLMGKIENL
ncbi:MAG: serpin family protein [Muribaculaceae bacterium]|nr:serpin family protein [Muribaculaceae bacterium]